MRCRRSLPHPWVDYDADYDVLGECPDKAGQVQLVDGREGKGKEGKGREEGRAILSFSADDRSGEARAELSVCLFCLSACLPDCLMTTDTTAMHTS